MGERSTFSEFSYSPQKDLAPLDVVGQRRDCPDGPIGIGEVWNPSFFQHFGRPAIAGHSHHDERLSAVSRRFHGFADHCGSKLFHVTDHLTEKEDERVDIFLVDQRPKKIFVEVRIVEQLPCGINRVGDPSKGDPVA